MLNKHFLFSPFSSPAEPQGSARGALRHSPECSVFKRFFSLFLAVLLCFVFISGTVTTHVSAASVSVPVGNWLPANIYGNYGRLTEDQKNIADFLTGGMGTAYNGLQSYRYTTIQNLSSSLNNLWVKYGRKIFEYTSPAYWQAKINSELADVLGSIVSYASRIGDSFSTWLSSFSSDSFTIPYSSDLNQAFTDYFSGVSFIDWSSSVTSISNHPDLYYSAMGDLAGTISSFSFPVYFRDFLGFGAYDSAWFDFSYNGYPIDTLFLNTSSRVAWLYNSAGELVYGSFPIVVYTSSGIKNYYCLGSSVYFSYSSIDQLSSVASDILNKGFYTFSGSGPLRYVRTSNFDVAFNIPVNKVVYGSSYEAALPLNVIDNLGFDDTYKTAYIDNPTVPVALDLSGFASDLIDSTDIKNSAIENLIDLSTDLPVDVSLVVPEEVAPSAPAGSGIIFDSGFFSNISKYITYLWHMTKPLVEFARDLLVGFTVVDSNGNSVGGLSWVVYGVISVGLCAGIVVKFLE